MKFFILMFATFLSAHAVAAGPILPEDLEETETFLVKEIVVEWKKPDYEVRYTGSCDGIIWNRTLLLLPANIPFDLSFHEFVDYQDGFSRPFPGDEIKGYYGVFKEDELNGFKRLLFKNLNPVFIVLKTKTTPVKEFRIAKYGSC